MHCNRILLKSRLLRSWICRSAEYRRILAQLSGRTWSDWREAQWTCCHPIHTVAVWLWQLRIIVEIQLKLELAANWIHSVLSRRFCYDVSLPDFLTNTKKWQWRNRILYFDRIYIIILMKLLLLIYKCSIRLGQYNMDKIYNDDNILILFWLLFFFKWKHLWDIFNVCFSMYFICKHHCFETIHFNWSENVWMG